MVPIFTSCWGFAVRWSWCGALTPTTRPAALTSGGGEVGRHPWRRPPRSGLSLTSSIPSGHLYQAPFSPPLFAGLAASTWPHIATAGGLGFSLIRFRSLARACLRAEFALKKGACLTLLLFSYGSPCTRPSGHGDSPPHFGPLSDLAHLDPL